MLIFTRVSGQLSLQLVMTENVALAMVAPPKKGEMPKNTQDAKQANDIVSYSFA